jgi:hypothetical protein
MWFFIYVLLYLKVVKIRILVRVLCCLMYLWAIVSSLKISGWLLHVCFGFGIYFFRFTSVGEFFPALFIFAFYWCIISLWKISVFDCLCFLVIVLSVCLVLKSYILMTEYGLHDRNT